ncbi:hypothetical protein HS048_29860 [Planomonospora sp. ID91781]|jgi:hypothetical protein|uniref:hypothetical protein n=1 Tax=Planomonospora sp. ID91781 TaxID=2738135 RepID=UPI0018C360C1|nr:hypothetical protein [Planomonospora sp. ID91781]MBG0824908.1 hypothetical protein [Planomonospora sp. ID91781]
MSLLNGQPYDGGASSEPDGEESRLSWQLAVLLAAAVRRLLDRLTFDEVLATALRS